MNKNKISIFSGLAGFIGFFLGTIIYELLLKSQFGDSLILKAIVVILTALITGIITQFYLKNKYPNLTEELKFIEKDERGQLIRGITSSYTLVFIAFLSIVIFTYAYFNDHVFISYMVAGGFVMTVFFSIAVNSFLNKSN